MKKKFLFYGAVTIILFSTTLQNSFAQHATFDSLSNEISRLAIANKTKSRELLGTLYQMAYQHSDSSLLIAYCLYEESLSNLRQGITDSLLKTKIENRLVNKQLSQMEYALLQSAIGINLMSEGAYADAFSLQFQALEIFKQLTCSRLIGRTLMHLGSICYYIDLLNLAISYYIEAMEKLSPNYYEYYFVKTSFFRTQALIEQTQDPIDSLISLIEIVRQKKYEELIPLIYLNIGAHFFEKDPEKAFPYFTKMQSINFDNLKWTAVLHAYLGSYYLNKKNYSKALHYLKKAQKAMEENNDIHNLSLVYKEISFIFEQQHQTTDALIFAKKSQELTYKLRSNLVAIETYQKYIHTFLETSQNELIIAEQTIKLKHKRFVIITSVAVFTILVILLLLLLTHRQKIRKAIENNELVKKLKHEKRAQQYEKNLRKLEKGKQEALIDAKEREIISYTILVSHKNKMLVRIRELLSQMFENKENSIKIAKKIDKIIQNNLTLDEEWENFKMHFEKVHPQFFEKLKQQSDELTEENLKMCAYIKMRMTTKQIAQLLQVVPDSIFTNRYRLRKKLHLTNNEDLDTFIEDL